MVISLVQVKWPDLFTRGSWRTSFPYIPISWLCRTDCSLCHSSHHLMEGNSANSRIQCSYFAPCFILFVAFEAVDLSPFTHIFFFFNWRLIALQYCSSLCHTLTWISHGCTCVPHPEPPSHLPPHPIPLGHPSAPALSTLPHALNLDWQSVSFMVIYMLTMLFSQIIPPSPSPTESKRLFFISASLLLSHI